MTGHALRLLRVGLNVADLPRALAYYRDALGFAAVAAADADPVFAGAAVRVRTVRLILGAQALELAAFDPPGALYPPDCTAADLWFQHVAIVTNDMATAYRRLREHGTMPISAGGPQRLPPASGAVVAYKFRDPDGHPLELIHFPRGVGDPAWQDAAPDATLGFDHSALSVADAERSLAFYGALGLGLRSRQINTGPAQDRLDGLSEAVVEVIALAPAAAPTPHVELLNYRTPRGRRDPNRGTSDIADSRLVLEVEDLTGLVHALAAAGTVVSPAPASRAALVRDPDGHAIVLIEAS